jgi:type II secretory pathway component PulJ
MKLIFKKIKNYKLQNQKGFTLIELLLYVSMSAVILFTIVIFISSLLEARVRNQTVATVNQEGNRVISLITQIVRNSITINSPTTGSEASVLSLNTGVVGKDPTVFNLVNGVIMMTEGANTGVAITSNLVIISNLNFRNLSRPGTPGNVDVTFTADNVH